MRDSCRDWFPILFFSAQEEYWASTVIFIGIFSQRSHSAHRILTEYPFKLFHADLWILHNRQLIDKHA